MFSTIIDFFIDALFQLSEVVPVTWFTFIGAFIEELIAPIPSPIVMTLGGSLAASQGSGWDWLLILDIIGAAGKTVAAICILAFQIKVGTWSDQVWQVFVVFAHGR